MADDRDVISTAARALADRAIEAARTLTNHGEALDDHQVVVERVAYAATEARVIEELARVPATLADPARVAAAELAAQILHRLAPIAPALGLPPPAYDAAASAAVLAGTSPASVEAIGAACIDNGGVFPWP